MTGRRPFTGQLGHQQRRLASKRALLLLRAEAAAAREETLAAYRRALAARPDDLELLELVARALDAHGPAAEAYDPAN